MLRKIHGEQSVEWADQRPFAPPVWRPPIWHMPEGLVIVVHLIKGIVRLIRFTIRHPLLVGGVVGLAWLGVRFGWAALVGVVGAASAGLTAWGFAHRASFMRLVAWPARARWRWVWVYRRHWQPVMIVSGLGHTVGGRDWLPRLARVSCDAWADRVRVRMLSGQAPSDWEARAAQLAHGFGVASCRVRSDRPGWVGLEFPRSDLLAATVPALPLPEDAGAAGAVDADGAASRVDLAGLEVGRCEDGTPWRLRLHGTHVLVAGVTGSGKGSVLWSTIRALLPAIRAGLVQVWAVDPKRMELSYGRALFHRYADDPAGMVALLEDAVTTMHDRASTYAGTARGHVPTVTHPFLLVVVDEVAFLTAYLPDRELRRRAEHALATLTTQGRSVGVAVLAALQDPRKEVLNLRNLFPDKVALRLDEPEQVAMVLGEGARDRGAWCDLIDPATPGVGYVRRETNPHPVRVRAAYVSDGDIAAMVAAYAPSRPALRVVTPSAEGVEGEVSARG